MKEKSMEELLEMYTKDFGRDYKKEDFTCDGCSAEKECQYSYDPYNLRGDCLASK